MCCILPVGPHSVDSVDSVREWVLEQRQHARYIRLGMAILGVCGHTARQRCAVRQSKYFQMGTGMRQASRLASGDA